MAGRDSPLTNFEKDVLALAQWLDEGPPLNTIEQLSLENHLELILLAYHAWKHRLESTQGPRI